MPITGSADNGVTITGAGSLTTSIRMELSEPDPVFGIRIADACADLGHVLPAG